MSFPSDIPGILGNTDLARFDAIIIGSGAGGSAAAYVLATAGQKILMLEAGDNHFPGLDADDGRGGIPWPLYSNDEIKLSLRRFAFQDPLVEPRTFRQTATELATANPDVNVMTRNVGGAAVISSVSYPRFTAVDFQMASALQAAGRVSQYTDTGFADWPLTYDELEPFYTETDAVSGIAGIDPPAEGSDPFQSWRSQRFPLPPQPVMYVARILANGAKQLGYHPFNYPSAIITAPYAADPRPTCVSCGLCTNYGCPRNAKGSPAVTTLRRALRTGNCQLRDADARRQQWQARERRRVRRQRWATPDGDGGQGHPCRQRHRECTAVPAVRSERAGYRQLERAGRTPPDVSSGDDRSRHLQATRARRARPLDHDGHGGLPRHHPGRHRG
jgi:choline dehydrogenase-like flavoprotein